MKLTVQDYAKNGAFVIESFATEEEVNSLKTRMSDLIELWNPTQSVDSVFVTTETQHIRNSFFLDSAEKISFFLEEDAIDHATGLPRTDIPKNELINKAGHALHNLDPVFMKYSFSDKVVNLVRNLGYKDPVLPQSMYIFKQPRIGGVVTSHQDSSFLHTEPRLSCIGLWLALDDGDETNGCLWVRPGSHEEPLRRRFVRNNLYNPEEHGCCPTKFMTIFKDESKWEGTLPGQSSAELRAKGFMPVPVRAGDLVGIHGSVDHLSLANTSDRPRHSYQLHLVEGPGNGVFWSKDNWLQYRNNRQFTKLSVTQGVSSHLGM
jgi:phytanoyl-CoA hydroxylase